MTDQSQDHRIVTLLVHRYAIGLSDDTFVGGASGAEYAAPLSTAHMFQHEADAQRRLDRLKKVNPELKGRVVVLNVTHHFPIK